MLKILSLGVQIHLDRSWSDDGHTNAYCIWKTRFLTLDMMIDMYSRRVLVGGKFESGTAPVSS